MCSKVRSGVQEYQNMVSVKARVIAVLCGYLQLGTCTLEM